MSKSNRLRHGDYQVVFRLLSDLRELRRDRPAMLAHLVESLLDTVGATGGFATAVDGWRPGGDLRPSEMVLSRQGIEVVGAALTALAANNRLWDDPTFHFGVHLQGRVEAVPFHQMVSGVDLARDFPLMAAARDQTRHVDHLVAWHQTGPVDGINGSVRGVSLHRYGPRERRFGGREVAVVRLLFEELNWLHETGRLTDPRPAVDHLSPRQRQVLDLLLAGQAPKGIARSLGLSVFTVRDHIKRLYAKLAVHGREELMAKFVR